VPLSTVVAETRLRVRYAETDAMGIAHHSAYVPWLEVGRVEWLRALGVSYAQLERDGYALPVIEVRLRYVRPARFDDALIVRAALASIRSREAQFVYEVLSDEERPFQLANGMTRHMCLLRGNVARLPDALLEAVRRAEQGARATLGVAP